MKQKRRYNNGMEKQYYKHKIENLIVVNKIVTIHYFEFDKHFQGPVEAHDFWELVYADKGNVLCSADGMQTELKEGEMLFHKPNELHSLAANKITAPNVFIISFECKSEAMRFFENRKLTVDKNLLRFIYSIIEESKRTFDLPYSDPALKKMQLLKKPTLGGQQLIKNYLELLLIELMRGETEKENAEVLFLPREELCECISQQVITFLKENVYQSLDIAEICRALNYNKSYLFKQFKQSTNCSIMAYFTKLKIENAKRLLRESDLSVTQISEKLSFDTPNYFSKTFKKLTRLTPLQYKKMHKR